MWEAEVHVCDLLTFSEVENESRNSRESCFSSDGLQTWRRSDVNALQISTLLGPLARAREVGSSHQNVATTRAQIPSGLDYLNLFQLPPAGCVNKWLVHHKHNVTKCSAASSRPVSSPGRSLSLSYQDEVLRSGFVVASLRIMKWTKKLVKQVISCKYAALSQYWEKEALN